MTNVTRPAGSPAGAPSTTAPNERRTRAGEFEAVLEEKRKGGRPEAREGVAAPGETAAGDREVAPEAGREARALPGDVMLPAGTRSHPGVEAPARADLQATIATIERLAAEIVRAAEVRLGPRGTAEARLELSLGELGSLRVALERDAEGSLAVRFEEAGARAAELLRAHAAELAERLDARGLHLREITVASADEPAFRFEPPRATPAGAARPSEESRRRRDEDEGRRQPPRREVEEAHGDDEP
jgi:hypothetical protein